MKRGVTSFSTPIGTLVMGLTWDHSRGRLALVLGAPSASSPYDHWHSAPFSHPPSPHLPISPMLHFSSPRPHRLCFYFPHARPWVFGCFSCYCLKLLAGAGLGASSREIQLLPEDHCLLWQPFRHQSSLDKVPTPCCDGCPSPIKQHEAGDSTQAAAATLFAKCLAQPWPAV